MLPAQHNCCSKAWDMSKLRQSTTKGCLLQEQPDFITCTQYNRGTNKCTQNMLLLLILGTKSLIGPAICFCWAVQPIYILHMSHRDNKSSHEWQAMQQPAETSRGSMTGQSWDLGVVWAQSLLLDGNAASVHLLSLLKLPAGFQQHCNVVQAGCHVHMVRPQLLLTDVQHLQRPDQAANQGHLTNCLCCSALVAPIWLCHLDIHVCPYTCQTRA